MDRSPAATAALLPGAYAASSRPSARAASQARERAAQPQERVAAEAPVPAPAGTPVAAQAVDLRGPLALGAGASTVHTAVRERVPLLDSPEQMPLPLETLAAWIRSEPAPA